MTPTKSKVDAFIVRGQGIVNCIYSPLFIATPSPNPDFKTANKIEIHGIWDTGATNTVISRKVIDSLKLPVTGIGVTNTASGSNLQVNTYIIDLYLPTGLCVAGLVVSEGTITDDEDCLIGMDIINLGDFSITNFNHKTTMSFRIPSLHEIDY